jgi:hypothetical protein
MTGEVEAKLRDHYKQVRARLQGPQPAPQVLRPKPKAKPVPPPMVVAKPPPPPPMPKIPPTRHGPVSYREKVMAQRKLLHEAVLVVVEAHTHLPAAALIGINRRKDLVRARSMVCWLASMIDKDLSARQIGIWLGRRDHTTVWWSLDRIRKLREIDGDLVQELLDLEYQVRRILQESEDV